MSYILPNDARIGVTTLSDLEYVGKCLCEKIPIVVTAVDFDGTETTTVLLHPDDPVMPLVIRPPVPLEIPPAYQRPPKPFTSIWRRLFGRGHK